MTASRRNMPLQLRRLGKLFRKKLLVMARLLLLLERLQALQSIVVNKKPSNQFGPLSTLGEDCLCEVANDGV